MAEDIQLILNIYKEIQKTHEGLRKHNSDRRYALDYAERKKTFIIDLHNKFIEIYDRLLPSIKADSLPAFQEKGDKEKVYFDAILKLLNIIQEKIDNYQEDQINEEQDLVEEMAQFDIKTASQIIPDFSGESEKILDFLSATEYYVNTLNDQSKTLLINFVVNIKVKGKAKNAISYLNITTFAELKKAISERFESKKTVTTLTQELAQARQGQSTVTDFADKIEKICHELSKIQILAQNNNANVISSLNDATAASAFKNGLKNELKVVVLTSRQSIPLPPKIF